MVQDVGLHLEVHQIVTMLVSSWGRECAESGPDSGGDFHWIWALAGPGPWALGEATEGFAVRGRREDGRVSAPGAPGELLFNVSTPELRPSLGPIHSSFEISVSQFVFPTSW